LQGISPDADGEPVVLQTTTVEDTDEMDSTSLVDDCSIITTSVTETELQCGTSDVRLCSTSNEEEIEKVDNDVAVAILKAFQLMEEVNGSQKNLLDIIGFGKELHCKGNVLFLSRWPNSWSACENVLKKAGYKEPLTYTACLNASHACLWSALKQSTELCKYCKQPGTIEFYYLKLSDKIERWCASESFCYKMTAHWRHRDKWLYGGHNGVLNEIWDGSRFSELSWFWDPTQQWLLPTRCTRCKSVISADDIIKQHNSTDLRSATSVEIECPICHYCFSYSPCYTVGDPRNIALIGHWDGWQPFSTSIKHSCGKISMYVGKCFIFHIFH